MTFLSKETKLILTNSVSLYSASPQLLSKRCRWFYSRPWQWSLLPTSQRELSWPVQQKCLKRKLNLFLIYLSHPIFSCDCSLYPTQFLRCFDFLSFPNYWIFNFSLPVSDFLIGSLLVLAIKPIQRGKVVRDYSKSGNNDFMSRSDYKLAPISSIDVPMWAVRRALLS